MSRAPDRAAAVRAALRELVAERGFHGASMSAIAARAGVATGTAYVHYSSKAELVAAAFAESKRSLGEAAVADLDPSAPPRDRFIAIWLAAYRHLAANPAEAAFLTQIEGGAYGRGAGAGSTASGQEGGAQSGPLTRAAEAPDLAALLLPLPPEVLYELGLAPAARLAIAEPCLDREQLGLVAEACWRAITRRSESSR